MAVDFGDSFNNSRYYAIAAGAGGLALPNSDWCVGVWVRFPHGCNTAAEFQYLVSGGTIGSANSFHLFFGDSTNAGQAVIRLRGAAGAEINSIIGELPNAPSYVDTTDRLLIIQRRGTNFEGYLVAKGAAVSAPGLTVSVGANTSITPASLEFGRRPDGNSTRYFQNVASELFVLDDASLTAAQVEALAVGVPITDVYSAPELYLRFEAVNDPEIDLANDHDADLVGSGFAAVTHPFTAGTTINATVEALSITAPSGTVQAGIDTTISAGAEALAVSGQAAQVASDRAINAQAEQLAIASAASVVSLQADIAASAEQISLSGNVARVSSDRAISAQLGQITLATPGAAVTLPAEILAGTEQLGISGQQADIAIGIHAQAESITLLGLVSAITADRTLAATVASISVSPAPATVTLGAAIPAATEVLRLDTLPSSVRLDVAVHGSVLAIALSELSATIGLARHLDAEVASLTITPQGAEIELASGVQAQVASLTLEAFAATIEAAAPGNLPPGLQFTLPENRLAFSLPVNRIHFSFRRS